MIPQIQEVNFPSYATLHQASATFVEMGERSISTQVRIDGDVVPSFAGWELRFKGERFVLPTVEPQAAKDTTTRNSLVDLTFESWIIQQLKRYYFFEPASIDTNTAIADKYVAPVRLSLSNFVALFNKVLKYYFGTSVQMSLFQGVGTDDPAIVDINYSYLWDVLGKMFEIYNVRWRIAYENSVYVIKVGYPADTINDHDFEYGYKGGLLRFERQVQDQDIRNILLGRGGEKNLPYRYFKKMDQQNTGWTPDPDAIPELANISFDRLRDVNFRWYVRGWMQNPLCDQAYAPYPTYDESQIPDDYKFAYLKGKTDDRFNPVEYVKDDDSIEKYGEHWGAVDNNDDIYPTIQGRSRSGLGRIDAVVDVSEIVTDDIEGASKAVSEVTNIGGVKSMSTSIASGQTASKSFTGETFAVKAGMTGVITAMPFKEFGRNETQDAMVTMSLTVEVINASTGQVAATGSGQQITTGSIPTGTYYLRVTALLENHSMTDDLEGTFGLNEVKLQSAGYDTEEWKPTFDIWVKNIWGTTQGSGETDLAYTERVWLPILGDRAGNEAKVVFSDGFMSVSSDYEFVIAAYPVPDRTKTILVDGVEVQSEWKITLRKSDAEFESTGLYIPNSTTGGKPVAGDHFFFIGIDMPFDYVLWGEEDLNTYKAAQLDTTAQVNPTWVINLDKVRVHTLEQGEYDTVLADRLAAGATVHIKDKRFTGGDVLTLYVQSMTYTWNEPTDDNPYIVPDIEVVLSDKVVSRTSVVEQIQGDVDVIRTQYAKIDDIEGVVRRVASPLFLKKTGESDKSLSPTQFAGKVSSGDFRQGDVGGAGWGAYTDGDGNAVYEVDKLVVRKELRVNNLVANQISYVGGKQINSAASIECVQVREESDGYVCYFDQKRGSIANLFVVGDYAMGQIFNPNDVEERYYRRRVNEVGENYIKLSKATGQVDGSGVPQVGDIIVQYGHESNTARQYAIVRDVIGGGYESMLMGLNSASAAGAEYYMSGRKSSLTGPRWFVGDTAGQHAEYYNGVLNITGRLSVSSQIEKSSGVYVGLSQYLNSLQDQIDGNIQSWAGDDDPLPVEVEGSVDPSTANYPASAWTTDTDRLKHMGDIYVNNTTGQGWRYTRQANDGDFYWMRITDEELANALQRISALETSVAGLAYLKAATNQGTLVEGGLVLTSLIQLGQTVNNVFTVWAGINGILDQTLANPLKSIAAWYGGPMRDLEMEGSGSGSGSGNSYAKSLFRMDGSGYLAGGNITWDNVGAGSIPGVHWDGNSVTIDGAVKLASTSGDSVTELLALVQELSSFFQKVNIGTAANPVYAVKVREEYAGLYSPGFLTAGGVGSGSGGGGGEIDLDRVWESLTNNTDKPNVEINIAHIPNITTSKVSDIETWIGNKGYLTSVAFSDLTSHPTTIAGYGITDAASIDDIAALSEGVAANSARLSSIEDWFKNPALDELQVNELNVLSEINGKIAWDNVIGKPSALPNPYTLTFGSKSYDGSEAKEILASDIGAATVVRLEEDEAVIAASIQSLWAQIDAVSSRNNFDELTASALYSDIIAANSIYAEGIELNGADLATTLTNLAGRATTLEGYFTNGVANSAARLSGTSALNIWGVEYWLNGNPKAVTGRPNLYIGTTQVQTSSATQDLAGIGSISAAGAITLTTTKKIYFGDTDHYLELDSNGFHFSHGVYSESFMTAGGLGSGGGGGSAVDMGRVWKDFTNNNSFNYDTDYTSSTKIDVAHIPNITVSKVSDIETWIGNKGYITKAVNDLANYYLKTETYTQAEVNALIGAINQFHYEIYASTSAVTDPKNNVLYLIGPTGSGSDKYEEYVYDSTKNPAWIKIGDTSIDLSPYFLTANFTQANIQSTLGISNWALASTKPSYAFSEITGTATASQIPSIENITNFSTKVYDASASRTANTVLAAPNGSNGAATFRAIVAADIPSLAISKITDLGEALCLLQAQIYAVSSRTDFDEINTSALFADVAAIPSLYVNTIEVGGADLAGTIATLATKAELAEDGRIIAEGITSVASRVSSLEDWFANPSLDELQVNELNVLSTINGNAASADILSTARTLWGRSFNGSANVSGDMTGVGSLTASGLIKTTNYVQATRLYLSDSVYFVLDSNGVKLEGAGFYTDSFVTAGGIGSGGGGGGSIDMGRVWQDLTNNSAFDYNSYTSSTKIDIGHIPDITVSKISDFPSTWALSNITGADDLKAIEALAGTSGLLRKTAANTWSLDINSYLTGNQTITLSGDVSGSGTTSIAVTIGNSKVTNAMLAGSIAWSKLSVGASDIVTTLGNTAVNRATADASGNTITSTYATKLELQSDETAISAAFQSLQNQINSVASRSVYDELSVAALFADTASVSSLYVSALVAETLSAPQLISTATSGAPLSVASSTKVTNLNADLLDGQDGSYYAVAADLTGAEKALSEGVASSIARISSIEDWFKNPALEELQVNELNVLSTINGNAQTASYLVGTSYGVGSASLPVYFSGGRPVAVTASSLFSYLGSSAGTNFSITIGGQNRTATLYATYDADSQNIASNFSKVDSALRSLQSQINSVAAGCNFDELAVTALNVDTLSIGGFIGGNVDVIGTLHTTVGMYSDGYVTAGASASSSDARLKNTIKPVLTPFSILNALTPREWIWNEKSALEGNKGAGFVAQEVQPILPFAVVDNGEYLALNYDVLHAYEISGLQELEARVRKLERENAELKRKLYN